MNQNQAAKSVVMPSTASSAIKGAVIGGVAVGAATASTSTHGSTVTESTTKPTTSTASTTSSPPPVVNHNYYSSGSNYGYNDRYNQPAYRDSCTSFSDIMLGTIAGNAISHSLYDNNRPVVVEQTAPVTTPVIPVAPTPQPATAQPAPIQEKTFSERHAGFIVFLTVLGLIGSAFGLVYFMRRNGLRFG